MSDESSDNHPTVEDKRPIWRKRRFWGGVLTGLGGIVATTHGEWDTGAVTISTQTIALALGWIGTVVFGYGQGAKVERYAKK